MRHRISKRKLSRTSSHRRALRRNLAQSLFEHGRITTTLAKAKDVRPFAEKLITLAKRAHAGSMAAQRRIVRLMGDRAVIPTDHRETYDFMSDAKRSRVLRARTGRRHRTGEPRGGMKFTADSIVRRLVHTIAPSFADRPGGYTRLLKLGKVRLGDAAPTAVLQLVGTEDSPGTLPRPERTARRLRADRRHAALNRLVKGTSKGPSRKASDEDEEREPIEPAEPETAADTEAEAPVDAAPESEEQPPKS